jgi:hypothetical protein
MDKSHDKSGAHDKPHAPDQAHGDDKAHAAPEPAASVKAAAPPKAAARAAVAGDPTKFGGGMIPIDDVKRVGSFAAVASWVFGFIGVVVIVALIGARPAWLFGVVGVPVVLITYLFGTFAGGRVSRNFLKPYTAPR